MKIDQMGLDLYRQSIQYDPVHTQNTKAAAKTEAIGEQGALEGAEGSSAPQEADRTDLSLEAQVGRKMTEEEREALVESLKADQEFQMQRFTNMMTGLFQKQGILGLQAGSDAFWQRIADGDFLADARAKAEAQEAISEDGYWGVKKTSERIFDFAYALAGEDTDKMRKMQEAVEEGFRKASEAWGGDLPAISGETKAAVNDLFSQYYAARGEDAGE